MNCDQFPHVGVTIEVGKQLCLHGERFNEIECRLDCLESDYGSLISVIMSFKRCSPKK